MRTFRVETNTFLPGLENAFGIYLTDRVEPAELQALEEKLNQAKLRASEDKTRKNAEDITKNQAASTTKEPASREQVEAQQEIRRLEHAYREASQGRPDKARQTQFAVRQLLLQLGVNMDAPNKAVFYNDLTGILMVRATPEELELVQAAIETLGGKPLRSGASVSSPDTAPAVGSTGAASIVEPQSNLAGNQPSTVSVIGKVNHQGVVELSPEGKIDLLEAIARMGGFHPLANKDKIEVSRNGEITIYRFNDLKRLKSPEEKVWLHAGDMVNIQEQLF